jgi:dTDP-D-glucose 4,6-dehydratase
MLITHLKIDSLQFTKDNILGTHTLLEICRLNLNDFPNQIKNNTC